MSIARKSLWIFVTQIVTYILGVGASIVVARALGPEGKGIFYLVTFLPHTLVALTTMGLDISILYFVGRYPERRRELVGHAILLPVLMGGFWTILYLALLPWLSTAYFKGVPREQLMISLAAFPLIFSTIFFPEALKGLERFKEFNLSVFIPALLSQILIIIILLVLRWGVTGAVLNWIFILAFQAALGLYLIRRQLRPSLTLSWELIRKMLSYGIRVHVGSVLDTLLIRSDIFLLGFFLDPAAVGYYSVALIIEKITYLSNSILAAFIPRISNAGREAAEAITPAVFRLNVALIVLASMAILLTARPLILIMYGKQFAPALGPLVVLLPGIAAYCISKVAKGYFFGTGEPFKASICSIVAVPFNIAANLYLIPRHGIMGAAAATTLGYMVYTIVIAIQFHRACRAPWWKCWLPQAKDWQGLQELMGWRKMETGIEADDKLTEPL